MLIEVRSGAQIGADIAGLRAAHACGIQTAGWMPDGWRTKHGPLPAEDVIRFHLLETEGDSGYPDRTRRNIRDAQATIQFAHSWNSPGERLTTRLVKEYKRENFPVFLHHDDDGRWAAIPRPDSAAFWIRTNNIQTLNVAGNADESIEFCVENYLISVFRELQGE